MSLSLDARMQMIGPISAEHADAALPTVEAWAARAENLTAFFDRTLSPETSPITAFVSSERLWRKPAKPSGQYSSIFCEFVHDRSF